MNGQETDEFMFYFFYTTAMHLKNVCLLFEIIFVQFLTKITDLIRHLRTKAKLADLLEYILLSRNFFEESMFGVASSSEGQSIF